MFSFIFMYCSLFFLSLSLTLIVVVSCPFLSCRPNPSALTVRFSLWHRSRPQASTDVIPVQDVYIHPKYAHFHYIYIELLGRHIRDSLLFFSHEVCVHTSEHCWREKNKALKRGSWFRAEYLFMLVFEETVYALCYSWINAALSPRHTKPTPKN